MAEIKGRPRKAVIQEKNIGFYLTWKQYAIVQKKAKAANVNISDYMRQVALNAEVKAHWTPQQQEVARKLLSIAIDVHQLMLDSKGMRSEELEQKISQFSDKIDEAIEITRNAG